MGKTKLTCLGIFLSVCSLSGQAVYRVVLDKGCVEQVLKNTSMQLAAETAHNIELDSIQATKEKIRDKSVSIELVKEASLLTLKNIQGFGIESAFYKDIALAASEVITKAPLVISTFAKTPMQNKALMINEVSGLVFRCRQLVADFNNIVNNSKVESPLKKAGEETTDNDKKGDGYNLLDRYERMALANTIATDIRMISQKLTKMYFIAQYGTWNNLFWKIDCKTWAYMYSGKDTADRLIQQWKHMSFKI